MLGADAFAALTEVAAADPPKLNDEGADGAGVLELDDVAVVALLVVDVPPNAKPPVAVAGAEVEADEAGAAGAPKEKVVPVLGTEAGGGAAPNVNPAIRIRILLYKSSSVN